MMRFSGYYLSKMEIVAHFYDAVFGLLFAKKGILLTN